MTTVDRVVSKATGKVYAPKRLARKKLPKDRGGSEDF